jgi:Protein of unknown function (DUF3667)
MTESCLNCAAPLQGPYCHACGQKAIHPIANVHDFVHEATHEFLHLDGKILNTVKLLVVKPGQLTREFVEGRRARYISPLRVYLTFSLIFFFLAAVVPGARKSFISVGPGKGPTAEKVSAENEKQADEIGEALMHNLPRAAFLLMPAFALVTWLFFRRQQPFYIPHLYYSVHFHAFAFLVLSVSMLLGLLGRSGKIVGAIAFLAIFPYHYIGLRRMFGQSRLRTFAKGTAVGIAYWLVLALTMIAVILGTVKTMH